MEQRVTEDVLVDVWYERERQRQTLGQQQLADGTGRIGDAYRALRNREACDKAAVEGGLTWRDVLQAEVATSLDTTDEDALREALIRLAAVTVQWIESLDGRWVERQRSR